MYLKRLNLSFEVNEFEYVLEDLNDSTECKYLKVAHTDIKLIDSPLKFMKQDYNDSFSNLYAFTEVSVDFVGMF